MTADPFAPAGSAHVEMLAAVAAAEEALRGARAARKAITRLGLPAESELREAIGNQLDAVLRRLETVEHATRAALRIMSETPHLSMVEAEMRRLELARLAAAAP